MARLRPIEKDDAPDDAVEYYELDEKRYGYVLNNTKLYAYNVPVLKAMKAVVAGYGETRALPLALKSVVRVRIALLNDCPFCADLHGAIGLESGLTEAKLRDVARYETSSEYSDLERLALQYADCITLSSEDVSDELFRDIEDVFSESELIELTFTIAVENFFSKFHHALRIEAQGFCAVPIKDPEPTT